MVMLQSPFNYAFPPFPVKFLVKQRMFSSDKNVLEYKSSSSYICESISPTLLQVNDCIDLNCSQFFYSRSSKAGVSLAPDKI
jgi:hypothetical protein